MRPTKELFYIPHGQNYLLYAPLERTLIEVEPGVVGFLNQVNQGLDPLQMNIGLARDLLRAGILEKSQKKDLPKEEKLGDTEKKGSKKQIRRYAPTAVTLLPTYDCNLGCTYCYARAGENIGTPMTPEIAKASIDFIVKNALDLGTRNIGLSFHGGGEPLLPENHDVINSAIRYLRYQEIGRRLKGYTSVTTNGIHSDKTLEWAIENFKQINVSIDGPRDIQDKQRPTKRGGSSFDYVMNTIKQLEDAKMRGQVTYGIRATITEDSVARMPEILEFFKSISTNKSFHLEPLFECGRCSSTQAHAPDPRLFLEQILKTEELAKKLGIKVFYSGASIDKVGETFCGACGSNFFVTPEGYATTCLEACRKEDTISSSFFTGQYNSETKRFEFNKDQLKKLKGRKVSKMDHCKDCFAKYNCCGDCPAKVLETSGDIMNPEKNARCVINRGLLEHKLIEAISKKP